MTPAAHVRRVLLVLAVGVLSVACQAGPPAPAPAEIRTGPPPWDAPRDAVSYIDAAGMERLPLDFKGPAPYYVKLLVTVDGAEVTVPADVGIDKVRAEQAALHTHAADGLVNIEAKTRDERPTLKQLFAVWGIRYDGSCLGDACGGVTVRVNGAKAAWDTPLQRESLIQVDAAR